MSSSFNPNRQQLSVLLDEYLNETSPMTEWKINYEATYKLVQKYVEGVSFHDITRAVRHFSPTYMITFENYIEVLKIFFEEQQNYIDKADQSIRNVLAYILNNDKDTTEKVLKIMDSVQKEFKNININKLSIINNINQYIKKPCSEDIDDIVSQMVRREKASEKIKKDIPSISQGDLKVHIHILDLFNAEKCISFLDMFKNIPLKIGFAVECQLKENSKYSKIVFIKNNNNSYPIYNRIDDNIILEFKYNTNNEKIDNILQRNYEMMINSPLIIKLYTMIIPNSPISTPMKFLYGYFKVSLVPILFAHGHEIQLAGNFIPYEKRLYSSSKKPKISDDPVILSFSVQIDKDPFICNSEPYGIKIDIIDGVDIRQIREKTALKSNSRSYQISAEEELKSNNHHFLCFYMNANVEFDTDNLYELLIRDSRKPGPEYSTVVRSPFALYHNQYCNLNPDSEYNDVIQPPKPFTDFPENFFSSLKKKCVPFLNTSTKMTQLERCIFLCNALIKNGHPSFVCCGSIDMCDMYCVISLSENEVNENEKKYLHLIPGHVFPISLLSYLIKKDEQLESRMNKMSNLRLNNMFDYKFKTNHPEYAKYKSIHIWCLSDILDDTLSASFHITTLFNDTNVWINKQHYSSITRINWDFNDEQLWFRVLDNTNSDNFKQYIYSKRKTTFFESFDKDKYEFYFDYELEQYINEHSIQIDKEIREKIMANKKECFSSDSIYNFIQDDDLIDLSSEYSTDDNTDKLLDILFKKESLSDISNLQFSYTQNEEEKEEKEKEKEEKEEKEKEKEKKTISNKKLSDIKFSDNLSYLSVCDFDDDSDSFLNDNDDNNKSNISNNNKSIIDNKTQNDKKNNQIDKNKYFFFRKTEAPYFMMPDELLEYIIENNGLRFLNSFDIFIDFTPLPLNNCKIDIIIAYNAGKFLQLNSSK